MKEIKLTNGQLVQVSDEDYDDLSNFSWSLAKVGYPVRRWYRDQREYMHRRIMSPGPGMTVDHINGDKLDNRRENLRVCTQGKNIINRLKGNSKPYSSQYKGVSLTPSGKWLARLSPRSGAIRLGRFVTEDAAARAYDRAARVTYGEFARLNFPD